ncbi:PepSY domain-containing protein [Flavobacteriaceae bacterium F08102]|nr:PepSY domain-containing protein [Flavobacteriaceae bacterium F08102]
MSGQNRRTKQAKILRIFRKIHRTAGALLFVFFFIVSVSAALLGWKKNSGDSLLPKVRTGNTSHLESWLPLNTLLQQANQEMSGSNSRLDRIDIRPDKGVVKFLFMNREEVQVDGATGTVLFRGMRRSDLIENIHDGSILDQYFKTNGIIKLFYSTLMSISLLLFTITGFWLWYGPKRMRKSGRN